MFQHFGILGRLVQRNRCSGWYEPGMKSSSWCAVRVMKLLLAKEFPLARRLPLRKQKPIRGEHIMGDDSFTESAPPSLRIAVASKAGRKVDQHFGQAEAFLVFDVTADGAAPLGPRDIDRHARAGEDPRDTICRMLADCQLLLVGKSGAAPQETLAGGGVEATDLHAGKEIEAALAEIFAAKTIRHTDTPVDASGFRLLHAMLRVSDLDRSLDFYTGRLGMRVIERRDHKKNQFSQAYLGYGDDSQQMALELVFNWMREEPYSQGDAFGHVAIQVSGITALCDRLAAAGVPMPRPPRSQRHGENIVAFIEDPDGHRIELVQVPTNL